MKMILLTLPLCALLSVNTLPQVEYPLTPEPIDVVIPCSPKDAGTLELCIQGIRKYGQNIRRIIVVSKNRLTQSAEWFDEASYPFSKSEIALEIFNQDQEAAEKFLNHPHTRIGWIYQQFLKLYAPFVIPGISSNVLILDADVIFFKPVQFMTAEGEPFFTVAAEHHKPYFEHMARLLPGLTRVNKEYSGIAHHMLFQKPILEDLYQKVHEHLPIEFWKAICQCIHEKDVYFSSFSEYEIYFNFALMRTKQAHLRSIKWTDASSIRKTELKKLENDGYVYAACHAWFRES